MSQGWIGNSATNSLYSLNSSLGLTPVNIGIGTNSPSEQLHTTAGVRFTGLTNLDTLSRIIAQDQNGKLYWRNVNSISGGGDKDWFTVGTTTSPQNILNNKYTLGNIGIGTVNPGPYRLAIDSGMVYIAGAINSTNLSTTSFGAPGGPGKGLQLASNSDYGGLLLCQNGADIDNNDLIIYFGDNPQPTTSTQGNDLRFCFAQWTGTAHQFNEYMRLTYNGNLGIGTSFPTQKLTVFNGTTTGTYTATGWVHS